MNGSHIYLDPLVPSWVPACGAAADQTISPRLAAFEFTVMLPPAAPPS